MKTILLSINPEHVDNIFNGTKIYEYRKVRCRKNVSKIVIYSTSPVMKVVGEARVDEILEKPPEDLWNETNTHSGIDKKFFDRYYEGKGKGVAYKLSEVERYSETKELSDYGVVSAPQSFVYLDC